MISHVMTLANGIIGVSILAMPFCFKQCGIILATLLLLLSSVLSRLACHFLIKSAVMSRRRNFEFLAFHAFGPMGKVLAELCIIGYLLGTCTAFFVVVGDLGPQIIGELIEKDPEDIRTSLLITTGVFIVLPLGLLRNIDSLASVSMASIGFYICLAFKVMTESIHHIVAADWFDRVYFWRTSGILQCLPIFALALFCQPQLFEIYEALPNATLDKMNEVVKRALNICTIVYISVGIFGYIAFCTQPFSGNILMSFEPSLTSEIIKIGFVLSVAFSFPLVIFPCRASLNSLLYKRGYSHEVSTNYISENRFRCLTIIIVIIALAVGISIPSIEFVLGLIGSTIGVVICLIFPAASFVSISTKNTSERLLAQIIMIVGIWTMILGTYANLYALEQSSNLGVSIATNRPLSQINKIPIALIDQKIFERTNELKISGESLKIEVEKKTDLKALNEALDNTRREPPVPVDRNLESQKLEENKDLNIKDSVSRSLNLKEEGDKIDDVDKKLIQEAHDGYQSLNKVKNVDEVHPKKQVAPQIEEENKVIIPVKNDVIAVDAIKKEDSELAADREISDTDPLQRRVQLQKTLEDHIMQQKDLMKEQKELLKDIEEKKKELQLVEQKNVLHEGNDNDIQKGINRSRSNMGLKIPAKERDIMIQSEDDMNKKEVISNQRDGNPERDEKSIHDNPHILETEKLKPSIPRARKEEVKNKPPVMKIEPNPDLVDQSKNESNRKNVNLIDVLSKQSDGNNHKVANEIAEKNDRSPFVEGNNKTSLGKGSVYPIPIALKMNQAPGSRNILNSKNGDAAAAPEKEHERRKRMVQFEENDLSNEAEVSNIEQYRNDAVVEKEVMNQSCNRRSISLSEIREGTVELGDGKYQNSLIKTSAHLTDQMVGDSQVPEKLDLSQKNGFLKTNNRYADISFSDGKKK